MLYEFLLYLLLGFSGIILFIHLGLVLGVVLNWVRDLLAPAPPVQPPGKVTVIVAARDEEDTLPNLFDCLRRQTFAGFETVLVNDRSTDGTAELMESFKQEYGSRVKVIHNDRDPGDINPKQQALDLALDAAEGEILIFTDSDCLVPPGWVEELLSYFQEPRIGIVFGQISLSSTYTFLSKYQAFDQPLIHQYSSGSAGLGLPTGCFGNNLAARRRVIQEIGGFKALGYTLTEDAALIAKAGKKKWKIRVSSLCESMIETTPKASWKDFINQHIRWNSGGFYSEDPFTRIGYRYIVLYLLASVLALPFAFFLPLLWILPVTSFISIGLLGLMAGLLYRRDKSAYLLRLVPYTLFFMFFYSLVTFLSILKISPEWKGMRLAAPHSRGPKSPPASRNPGGLPISDQAPPDPKQ